MATIDDSIDIPESNPTKDIRANAVDHTLNRDAVLPSRTYSIKSGHGAVFMVCTFDPKRRGRGNQMLPREVMFYGDLWDPSRRALMYALQEVITLAFALGGQLHDVIPLLRGIKDDSPLPRQGGTVYSLPDAVAKLMQALHDELERDADEWISVYGTGSASVEAAEIENQGDKVE